MGACAHTRIIARARTGYMLYFLRFLLRIYALLLAPLVAGGFRLQKYKKMQSLIKNISNRNENNVITQNEKYRATAST